MGKLNSAGFLAVTAAVVGDPSVFSVAARDDWRWMRLDSADSRGFVLLPWCKVSISRYSHSLSC
jgi:hypothetical protein